MKRRVVLFVVGFFLVLLLGMFFYAYNYMGLNKYIFLVSTINKISDPAIRKNQYDILFGSTTDNKEYFGVLANVDTYGNVGVWVWGRLGLKYFPAKDGATYDFVDGCVENKVIIDGEKDKKTSDNINIYEWSTKAKAGSYILIGSDKEINFFSGNISNILATNRVYLQSELSFIGCKN